jgi:hypothetical protein
MVVNTSASGYPFKFNPPLHPSVYHKVPDLGNFTDQASHDANMASIYDEKANLFLGSEDFSALRLGRIVMGNEVMSFAMLSEGCRYGFRFLYNPTEMKGSLNVGTNFIPDPSNVAVAILQDGLEQISFEVLLNRMPEVQGEAIAEDYNNGVSAEDMEELRKRGTRYDLEYLYRCANGLHNTNQRNNTGDIGILLPNPVYLHMGPYKTYGSIVSVTANDQIFSPDMVPMLTYVTISMTRIFHVIPEDLPDLQAGGITINSPSGSGSSGSGSSAGASTGDSQSGTSSGGDTTGNSANGDGTWTSGMSWVGAPSLKALEAQVQNKWPTTGRMYGYIGDVAHSKSRSEHNPVGHINGPKWGAKGSVHALDIGDKGIPDMMVIVNALIKDSRVWYVIYKTTIWSRTYGFAPRQYRDNSHAHHIHVSLNAPDQTTALANERNTQAWGF